MTDHRLIAVIDNLDSSVRKLNGTLERAIKSLPARGTQEARIKKFLDDAIDYLASDGMVVEHYDEDGDLESEYCLACDVLAWHPDEIAHKDDCLHELAQELREARYDRDNG